MSIKYSREDLKKLFKPTNLEEVNHLIVETSMEDFENLLMEKTQELIEEPIDYKEFKEKVLEFQNNYSVRFYKNNFTQNARGRRGYRRGYRARNKYPVDSHWNSNYQNNKNGRKCKNILNAKKL